MAIRVLLVEDSAVVLAILKIMLMPERGIEVVGEARTGMEALTLIPRVKPDLICTDLHMPHMSGLELTKRVMANCPLPILVISSAVNKQDTSNVFRLLEAGALDVFPKPNEGLSADFDLFREELIRKINTLSQAKLLKRGITLRRKNREIRKQELKVHRVGVIAHSPYQIIAVGASTGGAQALQKLFSKLPDNLSVPVICILHISDGFLEGFIDWLRDKCNFPLVVPRYGEYPQPGKIYFPREQMHLKLDPRGRFTHSQERRIEGHRPSITTTFQSVAQCYGNGSVGILLTGMGWDGVQGMAAITKAGGWTITQDEASCAIFGMGKAAINLGVVDEVLSLEEMGSKISHKLAVSV